MAGRLTVKTISQDTTTASDGSLDEELLARFFEDEGPASQDAFHILVKRHGPRVLGICRHILDQEHDAEDAFQATFLALARNGASIRDRRAVAAWLYEVAYRTSLRARARRSRRRTLEKQAMAMTPPRDEPDDQDERASLEEIRPVLHEEVIRLPEKYRIPVILSYLEGKTNEEVASLLHWPVGTVKGRLSRGRALLRSRLTRRGVALSTAMLLVKLSECSACAHDVPADLIARTVGNALGIDPSTVSVNSPSTAGQPSSEPGTPGDPGHPSAKRGLPGKTGRPDFWHKLLWKALPGIAAGNRLDLRSPLEIAGETAERERQPANQPNLPTKGPISPPLGPLLLGLLAVLLFPAAVCVGAYLASASNGGGFPDLRSFRSALSHLVPASNQQPPAHCQRD